MKFGWVASSARALAYEKQTLQATVLEKIRTRIPSTALRLSVFMTLL